MTQALLLLGAGTLCLYLGAEWLVRGAARGGRALGVSNLIIGLTIVSLGTSLPELVVSVVSALQGSPDLALGNVVGSNLANVGLILGLVALIRPVRVSLLAIRRDIPLMLLITVVTYPLIRDLEVGRGDGMILLGLLVAYLYYLARISRRKEAPPPALHGTPGPPVSEGAGRARPLLRNGGLVVVGSGLLFLGGRAIVLGSVTLGQELGISELVLGLSVVAVGTSLPELATSLVAALRGNAAIAVGNVVGSNIFNLALVLGLTSVIHPLSVSPAVPGREYVALLILSALLLPAAWPDRVVERWNGALFLAVYAAAWVWFLV